MSLQSGQLTVLVNDELTLNAGCWEETASDRGVVRVVQPPAQTMFQQLLEYLEGQLEARSGNLPSQRQEAVAIALVCWRWGTYVAVLMDQSKPLALQASDRAVSLISDGDWNAIRTWAESIRPLLLQ